MKNVLALECESQCVFFYLANLQPLLYSNNFKVGLFSYPTPISSYPILSYQLVYGMIYLNGLTLHLDSSVLKPCFNIIYIFFIIKFIPELVSFRVVYESG